MSDDTALRSMLGTDRSSYTTCKGDAFAAPKGFLSEDFHRNWSNDISRREKHLCEAYRILGRPDLALLVERGKKYQRIEDVNLGLTNWRGMVATRKAFKGLSDDGKASPRHEQEWEAAIIVRHEGETDLKRFFG